MSHPSITEVKTPQSRCLFALAWADITPPAGIYHRMWGAAWHDRASGVHRPLRASVAVFASAVATHGDIETDEKTGAEKSASSRRRVQGEAGQILLALDHCVLGAVEHEQLISYVAEASGQPKESILVVFSHTHAAGLMGLERTSLPGGDLIPAYLRSVAERATELVRECLTRLVPVGIVYGQGRCNLAGHRDFFDAERKQFVCGFNPGGLADDTVLVARVTDDRGNLLATVVNYACHPTTLAWDNTLISPDYVGAMRDVVEQATGAPCLFLQGASGDLGPREGYGGDTAVADRNGRQLGFAALSALTALPAAGTRFRYSGPVTSGAALGAWAYEALSAKEAKDKAMWQLWRWRERLPYRPGQPTPGEIEAELRHFEATAEAARAAGDTRRATEGRAMAERKRRLLHRLAQLPRGEAFPLQVVLWRMGDAFWLGVQGESYSLLQTELRRRFPDTPIVVASIAADWGASYLPPAHVYGTGIYQEMIAVVAAGSLEQLIDSIATRITGQYVQAP
ncbi:MAG: hypothetical protein L0Z50_05650 [Verrucomicrobiales bacterium]|nr:hypothetical protein [Verrucomicrobiales bacterium]